jgi:hypothetical protein
VGVSLISPCNDLLAIAQSILFGRAIGRTELSAPPIFILGHWRSGTTLLHELLVTNEDFESPNTYECFAPTHFLVSQPWMVRFGSFLLPKQRPMDNMAAGWKLPQEDEFALMNLGLPSPYLRIAFPNVQSKMLDWLDMQTQSQEELEQWRSDFKWFLQTLTYHHSGKRLVLKSPTHTGRLGLLAEMFPGAKFIHLTRDPAKMFSSTLRLWSSLEEVQALGHSTTAADLEEYVVECNQRMYRQFVSDRKQFSTDQLAEVSYEDLAENPFEVVRSLYDQLDLGDFEATAGALNKRLEGHGDYQPNQHAVDQDLVRKVEERWPIYCEYVAQQSIA